jgi:tripartite-type tricarboxylate transporter receptor subunit TctC
MRGEEARHDVGGAGGIIGTQDVLRAPADGHTILMGNIGPQAIAYTLVKTMPYRPDDLLPVSNMILGPNALVVNSELPVRTVAEFVAYARENPRKLNFGTPGIGQTPHIAGLWFNQLAGVATQPIHYRGSGPAATDLFAGKIQFIFDSLVNAIGPSRSGLERMLAVTGAERYPLLPDVPTMRESALELAPMVTGSWVGVFLKRGTPAPIVARLNADIRALLEVPDSRDRLLKLGGLPAYGTPDAFAAFVRSEIEKYAGVIRTAGLQGSAD